MDTALASEFVVGEKLADYVRGPIDRATLALFAGASNDHVRLHIDSDYARAAGLQDVIAHGMLTMAYLAQAVACWAPQHRLLRWNVRFTAITPLYAIVYCRGEVLETLRDSERPTVRIKVGAWADDSLQTIAGEALIQMGILVNE
jgi:acyl dehydratase